LSQALKTIIVEALNILVRVQDISSQGLLLDNNILDAVRGFIIQHNKFLIDSHSHNENNID